jgi:predicted nucleic acid-binding protein
LSKIELLYSTRTRQEFDELEDDLLALRNIPFNDAICGAAIRAMRDLAAHSDGYHRVKPADALIAAAAQNHPQVRGVLHYDHDFDRLADVLDFDSVWIAPPGSIP